MRRVGPILLAIALGMGAPTAWADESETATPSDTTPVVDTSSPPATPESASSGPTQDVIDSNPWAPHDSDGNGVDDSQENAAGYAIVDANGNTTNIIVCSPAFCGSGWIPTRYDGFTPVEFARVVPQTTADRNTGNVAGYWGHYDETSSTWTVTQGNSTFAIDPSKYPGEAGSLVCVAGCDQPSTDDLSGGEPGQADESDLDLLAGELARSLATDLEPLFGGRQNLLPGESSGLASEMHAAKVSRTAALVAALVTQQPEGAADQAGALTAAYVDKLVGKLSKREQRVVSHDLVTAHIDSQGEREVRSRSRALVLRDIASALSLNSVSDRLGVTAEDASHVAQALANPTVQRAMSDRLSVAERESVFGALERGAVDQAAATVGESVTPTEQAFTRFVLNGRLDQAARLAPRLSAASGMVSIALSVAARGSGTEHPAMAQLVALDALLQGRTLQAGQALYAGTRKQRCAHAGCAWVPVA